MAVEISKVPAWFTDWRHIGHAVYATGSPGVSTLCDSLFWGCFGTQKKKPKRICRECRKLLAKPETQLAAANANGK